MGGRDESKIFWIRKNFLHISISKELHFDLQVRVDLSTVNGSTKNRERIWTLPSVKGRFWNLQWQCLANFPKARFHPSSKLLLRLNLNTIGKGSDTVNAVCEPVKKTTSQILWPRIDSVINEQIKIRFWFFTKTDFDFYCGASREILKTLTSVAPLREQFRVLVEVFGCWTPSKRGISVHKNSLASCQRCRQIVEPRE